MFNVQLPSVVIEAGVQLAVIPAGAPLTASATAPVNPFAGAMLTVTLVLSAAAIVCEVGATVNVKSGGGAVVVTVTPTVTLWLTLVPAPEIVSVDVPATAVLAAAMVSVEIPEPVIAAGLKLADIPAGNPLADRFTVSV
jgi:hypothetical protein